MKIQTVNQLISVFKDISTRHYQINGFGIGDNWENGASEEKIHPVLWINPTTANMPESENGYKTFEIDFEVRVFDLVGKNEGNENEVLSDCIDILKDIIAEFKGHPYYTNSQLNIVDDISFEAFTEDLDEEVSGWSCDITLMTPILNSFCGIPAADITGFEFPGVDCPEVNVLCPVFVEDVTGVHPIVVTTVGTTKEISIVGGVGSDTYVISGEYNETTNNLELLRNDSVTVLTDLSSLVSTDTHLNSVAYDNSTTTVTLTLTDGTSLSVDLSELKDDTNTFVNSGAYDSVNDKIVLTLSDSSTVDIDTSALGGGGGGDSIYTADGTIGAGRIATLTDSLTFEDGTVNLEISEPSASSGNIASYPLVFKNTDSTNNNFVGMLFNDSSVNSQASIYTRFGTKNSLSFNVRNSSSLTEAFNYTDDALNVFNNLSADANGNESLTIEGQHSSGIVGSGARIGFKQTDSASYGAYIKSYTFGAGNTGLGFATGFGSNPTVKMTIDGNGKTTIGGKTELTSTDAGFLMNRLTTLQKNSIVTPDTHLMVFDIDLNRIERYDGVNWVAETGYGVLGIANTLGAYTYYSNYTDVIAAASSGDSIEQFGNIEDASDITVNINKPLTINLNGFTYTNSSTGTSDGVQVSTTEKVKILNGTIKRINGSYGTTSNRAIVLTAGGDLEMTGTDVINTTGLSLYSTGSSSTILNGRFTTTNQTINQVSINSTASLVGTVFESSAYNNFQGVLYNVKATSTTSNTLIGSTSEARFCEFRQTNSGGYDALLMSGGAKAFYCECFNVATNYPALRISGLNTEIRYCLGHSTLDNGIETGSNTPKGVYNCTGINDSGANKYGGLFGSLEDGVYNSSFTGLGGYGAVQNTGGDNIFVKCNFINKNAAVSNAAFYDTSAGTVRVYDCYSEQADSGKPNLRFTHASKVVYLAGNKVQGGTGISIAHASGNSQTTAADSTGNIILD